MGKPAIGSRRSDEPYLGFSGDQASKILENERMGKPTIGSPRSDEPYLERDGLPIT